MRSLRICNLIYLRNRLVTSSNRFVSSISSPHPSSTTLPWFIDPSEVPSPPKTQRPLPPHLSTPTVSSPKFAPLPSNIPPTSPIAHLHEQLKASPNLEPGTLLVREPIPTAVGPPLPDAIPKGRRKRGRTYVGEGLNLDGGGLWSYIVLAEVKQGTENRGAIESVVRLVRKTLLTAQPPLPLPPNSKRKVGDGWAMIDAGDFAVHVLSGEAREKFFPEKREW